MLDELLPNIDKVSHFCLLIFIIIKKEKSLVQLLTIEIVRHQYSELDSQGELGDV